jgi:hypothetical protein
MPMRNNNKIAGSSVVSTSFSLVVETVAVLETAELVLAARQRAVTGRTTVNAI